MLGPDCLEIKVSEGDWTTFNREGGLSSAEHQSIHPDAKVA